MVGAKVGSPKLSGGTETEMKKLVTGEVTQIVTNFQDVLTSEISQEGPQMITLYDSK